MSERGVVPEREPRGESMPAWLLGLGALAAVLVVAVLLAVVVPAVREQRSAARSTENAGTAVPTTAPGEEGSTTTTGPPVPPAGLVAYVDGAGQVLVGEGADPPEVIAADAAISESGLGAVAIAPTGDVVAYARNDGALVLASIPVAGVADPPVVIATDVSLEAIGATNSLTWDYSSSQIAYLAVGTQDMAEPGTILFANAAFPTAEAERLAAPPRVIGAGYCARPFTPRSLVNISGMSYGAISAPAVQALSAGAARAGCWLNTGEGGLSPHHRQGGCDLVFQIGTASYGVRAPDGHCAPARARELGEIVQAFELKLSQGAKPGRGGVLPGAKVTEEIARIRGIAPHTDSMSPARHPGIGNVNELLDRIVRLRELTGRPVGIKTAIGGKPFLYELADAIGRRGLADAPDFITVDGGEGGSGAAPQTLADHVGLPIAEALPLVVDALLEAGLKERVAVVASGKLVTAARAAWALCVGADFIVTARGFMFSLGCVQALRCHTNTCPTGIATHNKRLQRGLVVTEKRERVANYARNMNKEIDMIAHACGLRHARELTREHARIVQGAGKSMPLDVLYPYPKPAPGVKRLAQV